MDKLTLVSLLLLATTVLAGPAPTEGDIQDNDAIPTLDRSDEQILSDAPQPIEQGLSDSPDFDDTDFKTHHQQHQHHNHHSHLTELLQQLHKPQPTPQPIPGNHHHVQQPSKPPCPSCPTVPKPTIPIYPNFQPGNGFIIQPTQPIYIPPVQIIPNPNQPKPTCPYCQPNINNGWIVPNQPSYVPAKPTCSFCQPDKPFTPAQPIYPNIGSIVPSGHHQILALCSRCPANPKPVHPIYVIHKPTYTYQEICVYYCANINAQFGLGASSSA